MNTTDIESSVTEFLADNKITFAAALIGETVKENNWECDQWRVMFSKEGKSFETMFYTGLGHRQWDKIGKVENANYKGSRKSMHFAALEKQHKKPVAPNAASVLHSLTMDAQALDMSFDYWASDYGYDTDSRKALETYQACCDIGHKLKLIFSRAELETLREMLQDY